MPIGFENKKSKTKASFAPSIDSKDITTKFQEYFTQIKDPRVERTRYHLLTDIITIAILAVIAGASGWEDIEEYGINKQEWLKTFLQLPFGIPSPDTFRRVFERINPKEFEQCFREWVQSLIEKLGVEVVAIDGKTHRGSYDRESQLKALHTVSAWSSEHRLVLGQTKVSDKSNEITAIPALLEMLDISGCIITIDAMGTQKSIAQKIIAAGSDYILSLKDNHPTLHQQVKNWFEIAQSLGFKDVDVNVSQRVEKGHHRVENRQVYTVPVSKLPALHEQDLWTSLTTVVMVVRSIQHWNQTTHEVQFYITSLACDAHKIGSAIRQHWGIENSVHWTLDVTFNEDECRIRSLHSPQNFALLRRIALNALERETSFHRSIRQKSRRAAMNDQYMVSVLATALPNSTLS
ncbi:transposase [Nostoc commune NIES-4072]|uniref:Transposase n=1 Tax=Nostoc commune NIES-4072 TaxID=2005467 RepID=A0A2R5FYX4_NOSCO|nr:ISAs1 family transposase [Nostoc commune]BBD64685.1 transposase [Nostoc commune HK-02]BBD70079.1 transposase [Nostoc commune HK-02]BBD70594.1 transposase [Nostoc commune HK-02]GBG17989.1 transposase [Nostoc commune NIES-4072]GBG22747.1 transposase [Nostoc commune NIES-4072]